MRLLRRARVCIILVGIFLYDLVASTYAVTRIVLASDMQQKPAIIAYPVTLKTEWGVALLAYFASLTPGTTCLHVSDDLETMYVHSLNAPEPDVVVARFRRLYERWLLELER